MTIPIDIHWAIGRLLEEAGQRENDPDEKENGELEDAYNLLVEWYSEVPVSKKASGIEPYPDCATPESLAAWYKDMGWEVPAQDGQ